MKIKLSLNPLTADSQSDDGLSDQHIERPTSNNEDPSQRHAPVLDFIWAPDVLAILPPLLCQPVQDYSRPRLRNAEEVYDLDRAPPAMSCVQKIHLKGCFSSTKPPTMAPTTEPPTELSTRKAMAYSWSSGSHMSARTPSVTLPPAVDNPPSRRQMTKVYDSSMSFICHSGITTTTGRTERAGREG